MVRLPFWLPRSPAGYLASGAIGMALFALIALVAFDGRPVSGTSCPTADCRNAILQEAVISFAVALGVGTWIGVKIEHAYLRRLNERRFAAASDTPSMYFGPSTADVVQLSDQLVEQFETLSTIRVSPEAVEAATLTAYGAAFAQGDAMALALYVRRGEVAALVRLGLDRGPESALTHVVRSAVALTLARQWIPTPQFEQAWAPFESVLGSPPRYGPQNWGGHQAAGWVKPSGESPRTTIGYRLGSAWGHRRRRR